MESKIDFKHFIQNSYQILGQFEYLTLHSEFNKFEQGLIKMRTSQINNCNFCLEIHINDALKNGEDPNRIFILNTWRKAKKWFTKEEQIILSFLEETISENGNGLSDTMYNLALKTFGKRKTEMLMMEVANINGLNKIAISFNL